MTRSVSFTVPGEPRGKGRKPRPAFERVLAKLDQSGGPDACWPFMGHRNTYGYGYISKRGASPAPAHRVVFEHAVGAIPAGHYVCHRCDNPPCCNPAHLFAGTPKDNVDDMDRKGRRRNAQAKGERCARSKLTAEDVLEIRRRLAGGAGQRETGLEFGVSQHAVHCIARGRTWTHV